MLYLSRLTLNPRSRQVQAELRDPYEMHRTLSKAFGEGQDTQAAARCLFRVEESPLAGLIVLVQSRTVPLWERLTPSHDYLREPPQTKPFALALHAGQTLAFRLRANPTKRQAAKPEGRRQGDRVGLYTDEERLAWLSRQGVAHGFALETVIVTGDSPTLCQAKGNRAVFSAVRFQGMIRVTEPPAVLAAMAGGIGAGKGFGFGLLSLARYV